MEPIVVQGSVGPILPMISKMRQMLLDWRQRWLLRKSQKKFLHMEVDEHLTPGNASENFWRNSALLMRLEKLTILMKKHKTLLRVTMEKCYGFLDKQIPYCFLTRYIFTEYNIIFPIFLITY